MKKLITLAAIISLATFSSCKKADSNAVAGSTQTINVVLEANKSYAYELLGSGSVTDAEITTQASHAAQSRVAIVPGATTTSFQYTPQENYIGSDQVTVHVKGGSKNEGSSHCGKNEPNKGGKCNNSGGSCGKHHHDKDVHDAGKIFIFNITVNPVVSPN